MSMFKGMNTEGMEETKDTLGGFRALDSDAYEGVVKLAYAGRSSGGASFIGLHLMIDGKEYRENLYYTNKQGENFYLDKNTGKKRPMPAFTNVDELCLLTTGQPLENQETEERIVKLYDPTSKTETNQSVPVLIDVMDKPIIAGILKEIVDKTQKQPDGTYAATGETREENRVNKFFHAETQGTVNEYKHDQKLGEFYENWVAQNKGSVSDRSTKAGAAGARPGAPGASAGAPPQSTGKSLFNRN